MVDIPASLHTAWALLLFGLLTVEVNDSFRYLATTVGGDREITLLYLRPLTLALVWISYSLPLVWAGLRIKIWSLVHVGAGMALLAVGAVALGGLSFQPIVQFVPVLNVRVLGVLLIIGGMWLHLRWLGQQRGFYLRRLGYTLIALLFFELLTVETRDFFERLMVIANGGTFNESTWVMIKRLQNMQQLAISSIWLLYATVLIGLGFWRRVPGLRMGAILLAGMTILKIFLYDLVFLESLYRIFSFIGLGVILMGVSYVYQRYKSMIFGTSLPDAGI